MEMLSPEMRVKRHKQGNWFAFPRTISQDKKLADSGVAVMAYLLSKPDNWEAQAFDICERFGYGRDKWRSVAAALETAGYLHRIKGRDPESGQFAYALEFTDEPVFDLTETPEVDLPSLASPTTGSPATGLASLGSDAHDKERACAHAIPNSLKEKKEEEKKEILTNVSTNTSHPSAENNSSLPISNQPLEVENLEAKEIQPALVSLASSPAKPKRQPKAAKPANPVDPRRGHWGIALVRQLTKKQADESILDILIKALGDEPQEDRLTKCFQAWRLKDYKATNYAWVTQWYVDGIPVYAAPQDQPRNNNQTNTGANNNGRSNNGTYKSAQQQSDETILNRDRLAIVRAGRAIADAFRGCGQSNDNAESGVRRNDVALLPDMGGVDIEESNSGFEVTRLPS